MRHLLLALSLLLAAGTAANGQISIGIGMPGLSIGINVPAYPQLVRIPGYPVYYDPRASSNYFFYDGLYWVLQEDGWYSSSWYNGPWHAVEPEYVPLFVLRVPVRYYRQPPSFFHGWRADAPPRWGEHWGKDWQQRRTGWDRWNQRSVPAAAPLPSYQRQYSGARYPQAVDQQHAIRSGNYRYQPREAVTREVFQQHAPAPVQRPAAQQEQQHPQPRTAQPPPQALRPQAEPRTPATAPQRQQPPAQTTSVQPEQERQPQGLRAPVEAQRGRPEPQGQGHQQRQQPPAQATRVEREQGRQPEGSRPPVEAQRGRPEPQGQGHQNKGAPQEKERGPKD